MCGPSVPAAVAPDYRGAAQEQAAASKEIATQQTYANRPTLITPWGRQDWATGPGTDPVTGQPITKWATSISLTPTQQAALDSQSRIQQGRSGAAETLLGQATGGFQQQADWGGLPEAATLKSVGYDPTGARNRSEQALFQRQMGMIEPGLAQSESARRTRLANMGITPEGGSEAWKRAQTSMDATRQKAIQDASLAAIAGGGAEAQRELGIATGASGEMNKQRQQAIAEMAYKRGMSLNELNALLTGQQVQSPNMPTFNQASAGQAPNLLGAAQAGGDFALQQQKMNESGGTDWGTLIGTAGKAAMMMSDARLKRNTIALGRGWYAFNYLWDRVLRFGVMAQEVFHVKPEAVFLHPSGYLMVDYSKL